MRYSFLLSRVAGLWCLVLLLAGCVDPYSPDVVATPPNYLVVDGFLNARGITTITLSRTYAVAAKTAPPTESRAVVYIEEEGGTRIPLPETTTRGTYASAGAVLNPAKRYRLSITLQGGKSYASDYVPVKITPVIDNLTWRATNSGFNAFVTSHDASNNTQYYRWEYEETWEISTPYDPEVEYVNRAIRPIVVRYPRICWSTVRNNSIEISKTTGLIQDLVSDYPVRNLPTYSPRLYRRYSILVQQHALTRQEYEYWDLLRKNTEKIGTLFDPQPSQLTGNVHCLSNPDDLALGYIGAQSVTEKRIIVSRSELPRDWPVLSGYEDCIPADTVFLADLEPGFGRGLQLPIDPAYNPAGKVIGYRAAVPDCIDCRKRGSAVKPSFWP